MTFTLQLMMWKQTQMIIIPWLKLWLWYYCESLVLIIVNVYHIMYKQLFIANVNTLIHYCNCKNLVADFASTFWVQLGIQPKLSMIYMNGIIEIEYTFGLR